MTTIPFSICNYDLGDVSERALREIYLKPFQIALKHAEPWALMSAHNRVNGAHVSENKRLLNDILRKACSNFLRCSLLRCCRNGDSKE
ncbi:hypothetical protein BD779DRAFT_1492632 [Infundibulicybe gibba]|nr:hypothetical protein BD779DRAFT_1492632 [Infundibulicybe gibba]